jgi:hypothetical protein
MYKNLGKLATYITGMLFIAGSFVFIRQFILQGNLTQFGKVWFMFFLIACLPLMVFIFPGLRLRVRRLHLWILAAILGVVSLFTPAGNALVKLAVLIVFFIVVGGIFLPKHVSDAPTRSLERIAFGFCFGIGLTAYLVFWIGMVGKLTPAFLWILFLALLIPTLPVFVMRYRTCLRNLVRDGIVEITSKRLGFAWIGIFLGTGTLIWALSPSIRYDAMVYHLAAPEAYLQFEKIIPLPMNFQTYQSHVSQMVNVLALGLFGQPLPGLLHMAVGVATVFLTYRIGQRLGGKVTGIIGAFLFASLPLIGFEAGTAFNDLYVALFLTAGVVALLEWQDNQRLFWLAASGVLAGLALSVKMSVVMGVFSLGLALMILSYRRYRLARQFWICVLIFLFTAGIVFLPWAIRDYLWTGDPLFPLLAAYFPASESQNWELMPEEPPFPQNFMLQMLRLPWDLTFNTGLYYHGGQVGALGVVPMMALPWLYLSPVSYPKNRRMGYLLLLGATVLAIVLYLTFTWQARTMLFTYPFLAILAALNLNAMWKMLEPDSQQLSVRLGLVIVLAVYIFATRVNFISRGWEIEERIPYRVALGLVSTEEYLSKSLPVYSSFKYLDSIASDEKVLSIGSKFNMYTHNEIWGDPVTAGYPMYILDYEIDPGVVFDMLRQEGYENLLVDWAYVRTAKIMELPILSSAFLKTYTEIKYSWANFAVYSLSAAGDVVTEPRFTNLLDDPGFEMLGAGVNDAAWQTILANQENVSYSTLAHTGNYALRADGDFSIQQPVQPVKGGEIYSLSHWTVAEEPGQIARLQINWMDANGQFLDASILLVDVDLNWRQNGMAVTAPMEAAKAGIYVSVHGGSHVTFDDYCFSEGVGCLP